MPCTIWPFSGTSSAYWSRWGPSQFASSCRWTSPALCLVSHIQLGWRCHLTVFFMPVGPLSKKARASTENHAYSFGRTTMANLDTEWVVVLLWCFCSSSSQEDLYYFIFLTLPGINYCGCTPPSRFCTCCSPYTPWESTTWRCTTKRMTWYGGGAIFAPHLPLPLAQKVRKFRSWPLTVI